MDRWEYCYADMSYHRVYYFTSEGFREEKIRRDKEVDETKDDAFARLVAKMGMDGWELTSGVGGGIIVTLFFKRKLPAE
jgi:hypothetical protein